MSDDRSAFAMIEVLARDHVSNLCLISRDLHLINLHSVLYGNLT